MCPGVREQGFGVDPFLVILITVSLFLLRSLAEFWGQGFDSTISCSCAISIEINIGDLGAQDFENAVSFKSY